MIDNIPLPDTDVAHEAPFWAGLQDGVLKAQKCASCGHWHFPARFRCEACGSGDLAWQDVSGRATVWSVTQVHPPVLPAFAPFAPYAVVLAELKEQVGLRMVGNVIKQSGDAINAVALDDIAIGAKLEAEIVEIGDGVFWPHWRLV